MLDLKIRSYPMLCFGIVAAWTCTGLGMFTDDYRWFLVSLVVLAVSWERAI